LSEDFIALGALVQLQSDGPALTIRSIDGDDVKVDWFDKGALRSATFKNYQLKKFTGPKQTVFVIPDLDYNPAGDGEL